MRQFLISGINPLQLIDYCLAELAAVSRGNLLDLKERSFLIVPEALKADIERRYLTEYDVNGLMLAEVLSFQRLAYRFFSIAGGLLEETISGLGKSLLLQKIIYENPEKFKRFQRFAGKPGYTSQLESVLSDFKKFEISEQDLRTLSKLAPPSLTKDKLSDLWQLQTLYEVELNKVGVFDKEDNLDRLADLLEADCPDLSFLAKSRIWITGFADIRSFNRQELRIIKLLSGLVHELSITVCTDLKENTLLGQELFEPGYTAYRQLKEMLPDIQVKSLKNKDSQAQQMVQQAFLTGSFSDSAERPEQPESNPESAVEPQFNLVVNRDKRQEWSFIAGEIKRLIVEQKIRQREIGIALCSDAEDKALIKSIFREFGLQTFMNERIPLQQTALFRHLQGFLNLTGQSFSLHDLLNFFRSGLAEPDISQIDRFENTCLQYGLRYSYELENPGFYQRIADEEQKTEILYFKNRYLDPLLEAGRKLRALHSGRAKAEFLLNLLAGKKFKRNLEQNIALLREQGEEDIALSLSGTWEIILRLLEEATRLFDQTVISQQAFIEIITNALSGEIPAAIPVGLDRIRVGSIREMIYFDCRVLFIAGVSGKDFPPLVGSDSFLQQIEVEWINSQIGRELPYYRRNQMISGQVGAALLFSGKKEKIYLSATEPDSTDWAAIFALLNEELGRSALIVPEAAVNFKHRLKINKIDAGDPLNPDQRWLTKARTMRFLRADQQMRLTELKPTLLMSNVRSTSDTRSVSNVRTASDVRSVSNVRTSSNVQTVSEQLLPQAKSYWHYALQSFPDTAKTPVTIAQDPLWELQPVIFIDQKMSEFLLQKRNHSSASSLECYAGCPYQFFGQYLLNLRERPLWDADQRDRGTLIHKMMEMAISGAEGDWLRQIDEPQFYQRLFAQSVEQSRLVSYSEKVNAVRLGTRIKRYVRAALYYNRKLLQENDFKPSEFEWRFLLPLRSGKLPLTGIIDRVDQNSEGEYRIFDYKTGNKQVDLNRIYYGLDLQLGLYQAAWQAGHAEQKPHSLGYLLFQNKGGSTKKSLFAPEGSLSDRLAEQKLFREVHANPEEINIIGQHALLKANQAVDKIASGNISPIPQSLKPDKIPCDYCRFKQMCRYDQRLEKKRVRLLKPVEIEQRPVSADDAGADDSAEANGVRREASDVEIISLMKKELRQEPQE